MPLRRRSGPSAPQSGKPISESFGSWAKSYLPLCEFLSASTYEDGTSRELGKVTFMVQDGLWKASLNDLDLGQYCFVSAESPDALLRCCCRAVEGQGAEWRVSKPYEGRKGKRG